MSERDGGCYGAWAALPELLEVLSPLESIPDRVGVARVVARRVAATVAADCVISLVEDWYPKELPVRSWFAGPVPEAAVVARVVASSAPAVVAGPCPEQAWAVLLLDVGKGASGRSASSSTARPRGSGATS
ncbi:MAG: hypothetical protein M0005_10940 [Actinomycetota bacterium]|jgi:hypothetical protein|nr:hypothetical protein [Actinomycetota bacterium]